MMNNERVLIPGAPLPIAMSDTTLVRVVGGAGWNIYDTVNARIIGTTHPNQHEARQARKVLFESNHD